MNERSADFVQLYEISTGYRCARRYRPEFSRVLTTLFQADDTLESHTGARLVNHGGWAAGLIVCWPGDQLQRRAARSARCVDAHSIRAALARRADDALRRLRGAPRVCGAADCLHVYTLAIAPERRRRGLATALLDEAIQAASRRGFRAVALQTLTANTPACALYSRHGFDVTAEHNGYLSMQRTL